MGHRTLLKGGQGMGPSSHSNLAHSWGSVVEGGSRLCF